MQSPTYIHYECELSDMLKYAVSYLERDGSTLLVRIGNERHYHHSLFLRNHDVEEQSMLLTALFGGVRSLSAQGVQIFEKEYAQTTDFKNKWWLFDEWSPYVSGLVLAGREYAQPGKYEDMQLFDRRAAHVACCVGLALPKPFALRLHKTPTPTQLRHALRGEGVINARVTCTQDIPIQGVLPVRAADNSIYYPRTAGDIFGGTWTLNEVRYALSWGYRIDRVAWVASAHKINTYPFLQPFAERIWTEREASTEPLAKALWKMLGNRTIGRLGMTPGQSVQCVRATPGGPGAFLRGGQWWRVQPATWKAQTNRIFAAYVFAEQRIHMHKILTSCREPVYAHTDSVACAAPPPR